MGTQEAGPASDSGNNDRRRIGRIVHDDRGNALVEWEEAPADYERPVLEIRNELSLENHQSFDPYSSSRALDHKAPPRTGNTSRTDLRKLSEWIKMMRELEQRKLSEGEDEE